MSEDVMERDAQGRFVWLVISEVVPLVRLPDQKIAYVTRNIERWCAIGVLAPYAYKASRDQILELVYAGRMRFWRKNHAQAFQFRTRRLCVLFSRGRKKRWTQSLNC